MDGQWHTNNSYRDREIQANQGVPSQQWFQTRKIMPSILKAHDLKLFEQQQVNWNLISESIYLFNIPIQGVVLDLSDKGQIISKRLLVSSDSSKKRTNKVVFLPKGTKNEFVRLFFGRIWGYQKVLSKLSDL